MEPCWGVEATAEMHRFWVDIESTVNNDDDLRKETSLVELDGIRVDEEEEEVREKKGVFLWIVDMIESLIEIEIILL